MRAVGFSGNTQIDDEENKLANPSNANSLNMRQNEFAQRFGRGLTDGTASIRGGAGVSTPVPPEAVPAQEDESMAVIRQINDSPMSSVTNAATAQKMGDGWILQDKDGRALNKKPVTMGDIQRMGRMRQPGSRVNPGDVIGEAIGGLMPESGAPQTRGRMAGSPRPQQQQQQAGSGLQALQQKAANRRPAPEMRNDPMGPIDVVNHSYGTGSEITDYRSPRNVADLREQRRLDDDMERFGQDQAKYGGSSPYLGQDVQEFDQSRMDNPINREMLARGRDDVPQFDNTYMQKRYGGGVSGDVSGDTGYRSDNDPRQIAARKEAQKVHERRVALNEQQEYDRMMKPQTRAGIMQSGISRDPWADDAQGPDVEKMRREQLQAQYGPRQMSQRDRIAAFQKQRGGQGGMTEKEQRQMNLDYAKFRNDVNQQTPKRTARYADTYGPVDPLTGKAPVIGEEYTGYSEGGIHYSPDQQQGLSRMDQIPVSAQQSIRDKYREIGKSKNKDANMAIMNDYLLSQGLSQGDIKALQQGD